MGRSLVDLCIYHRPVRAARQKFVDHLLTFEVLGEVQRGLPAKRCRIDIDSDIQKHAHGCQTVVHRRHDQRHFPRIGGASHRERKAARMAIHPTHDALHARTSGQHTTDDVRSTQTGRVDDVVDPGAPQDERGLS